jgi:hypothetical protein
MAGAGAWTPIHPRIDKHLEKCDNPSAMQSIREDDLKLI